ncbi:ribonuclease H, partial [Trifolium pratense]
MHPWKAPGPDGFPAGFYQKSWDHVGETVCTFVENVWKDPSNIVEVNQTDICLIPKIPHPEHVKQFRPISLCNTSYKIVTKVIVERLKDCISKLISPFQTGFVPGRNIDENIIVAKEIVHTMNRMKGKKGAFAIKVDLAKAYDKLSWEFIWRVLMEINFPETLINVIMHAVTSVMTNVKWNGARSTYFKPQRGIRQGDPISPYLFVLCMDKQSHLILHSVAERKWHGIKSGSEEYWCSVLRGKYNGDIGQNVGTVSGAGSNLRKTLSDLKPMIERFSFWDVGDGCDIDAWRDAWIEEGLCLDQHMHIPSQLQGKRVCDLVDEEGQWNWNLFDSWMPSIFKQKIAAVLPPNVDNGRDERVGVGGNKRDFSVTSMYNNLCGFNKEDAHYMCVMGLSHATCSYCQIVEETTIHVLRDCTLAKEIWLRVVPMANRGDSFMGDLQNWFCFNMNNSVTWSSEGAWNVFWAVACYLLWIWRNKELHIEGYTRPNRPAQQVRKMAGEYIEAMKNSSIVLNRVQVASMVGWIPPKSDFIKLNTDCASKRMQLAGCGGVARGSQGEWIGGYAKCVGMCNA